jgi:uncharacterized membrane protein
MVVATFENSPAAAHRIELSPNCSLTPATARVFVGSLAALTFATAGYFTWLGFWPIFVVAVLEIGLLWWAVQLSLRAGRRREIISVSDDLVVIEQCGASQSSRMVFPRHWATVKLRDPQVARYPSRLLIESHGRGCEVGRFLTEDERRILAGRLRELVGRTSQSPAL